jgi:hypothetical protein
MRESLRGMCDDIARYLLRDKPEATSLSLCLTKLETFDTLKARAGLTARPKGTGHE